MEVAGERVADGELGPLIARGRDAEVFALGTDRVARRTPDPRDLTGEAVAMEHARRAGYPVPRVWRVAPGEIVLDRVEGPTMLDDLARRPWRLRRHARTLADLHGRLHRIAPPDGPADGPALPHRIAPPEGHGDGPALPHRIAPPEGHGDDPALPHRIAPPDGLADGPALPHRIAPPDGPALLHMDLHPANVMLAPTGPVVIDWTNATAGPPGLDLAWTWVVMVTAVLDEGEVSGPFGRLTGRVLPWYARRFVASFLAAAGRTEAEAELAAAAERRLADPGCRPAEATRVRALLAATVPPPPDR